MQMIKKDRKQPGKSTGSYTEIYNAAPKNPPETIKHQKRKWIYGNSNL